MKILPGHWGKLTNPVTRKYTAVKGMFLNAGWTPTRVLLVAVCLLITTSFVFNIYISLTSTAKNYELLGDEQQKLAQEKDRASLIEKDLAYYNSFEYKQRYAYDSLNLAKPGEKIYLIESNNREKYDLQQTNNDPVKEDDNLFWWQQIAEHIIQL